MNAPFAFPTSVTEITENVILIDWLTVTCHGFSVDEAIDLLGMQHIPFEDLPRGLNGYPARKYWNGVSILYGCDDPSLTPIDKLRDDMGICINLSGTGCRSFESHGRNDWIFLFEFFQTYTTKVREKNGRCFSFNITRLDLAFDDHIGTFNIYTLAQKVRDREFVSPFKVTQITYSDDQEFDLQGLTINIGSMKSDILFRIYNKAAERGFKDRHWVRFEMQLRSDRAHEACRSLITGNISHVFKGILSQYLRFVDPGNDNNKSRWVTSDFWLKFIDNVECIKLWVTPGEEYNHAKTEYYYSKQYGMLMSAMTYIYDPEYILDNFFYQYSFDQLDPKYKNLIRTTLMEGIR